MNIDNSKFVILDKLLEPGETIIYRGKPNLKVLNKRLIRNTIFMPIFALTISCGFFVFMAILLSRADAKDFIPVAIILGAFGALFLIGVIAPVVTMMNIISRGKSAEHIVTDRRFIISNDYITKKLIIINFKDIDSIGYSSKSLEKRFNVGNIIINTLYTFPPSNKFNCTLNRDFGILAIDNHMEVYKLIDKHLRSLKTEAKIELEKSQSNIEMPLSNLSAPKMKEEIPGLDILKKQAEKNKNEK